jgi:hypothetical protein
MQRKFKLIKKYKSHKKGLIVSSWKGFNGKSNCYKSETIGTLEDFKFSAFDADEVENSEFWEEIIEEEIEEEETHRFYIDEPVKIWTRTWYDVKGTYEEALAYMRKELENPQLEDDVFDEFEYLYDTVENGCADEKELFNEQGDLL